MNINGEIILFSKDKRRLKIFDLQNELIITIYGNKYDYLKIKNNIEFYKRFYLIPDIKEFDDSNQVIIEKRIKNNLEINLEEKFKNILDLNLKLFYTKENIYKTINFNYNKNNIKDEMIRNICDKLEKINIENNIPFLYLHGDMWESNIIFNDNGLYVIDWENAKEYPFFYDIFMFMFVEVFSKNNYELLDNFFNSKYDLIFEKIFNIFDFEFTKNKKKLYFLQFMYFVYLERWSKISNKKYKVKLYEIIKRYKLFNIEGK